MNKDFWGESIWNTEVTYYKWKMSWKFPFIKRVIVFKGTIIDMQRELNRIRSEQLKQLNN